MLPIYLVIIFLFYYETTITRINKDVFAVCSSTVSINMIRRNYSYINDLFPVARPCRPYESTFRLSLCLIKKYRSKTDPTCVGIDIL